MESTEELFSEVVECICIDLIHGYALDQWRGWGHLKSVTAYSNSNTDYDDIESSFRLKANPLETLASHNLWRTSHQISLMCNIAVTGGEKGRIAVTEAADGHGLQLMQRLSDESERSTIDKSVKEFARDRVQEFRECVNLIHECLEECRDSFSVH